MTNLELAFEISKLRVIQHQSKLCGDYGNIVNIGKELSDIPTPMSMIMGIVWAVYGWRSLLLLSTHAGARSILDELDKQTAEGITENMLRSEVEDICMHFLCMGDGLFSFLLREKSKPIHQAMERVLAEIDPAIMFGQTLHAKARIIEGYIQQDLHGCDALIYSVLFYMLYQIERVYQNKIMPGELVLRVGMFCDTSLRTIVISVLSRLWEEELKNPRSILHYHIQILCDAKDK